MESTAFQGRGEGGMGDGNNWFLNMGRVLIRVPRGSICFHDCCRPGCFFALSNCQRFLHALHRISFCFIVGDKADAIGQFEVQTPRPYACLSFRCRRYFTLYCAMRLVAVVEKSLCAVFPFVLLSIKALYRSVRTRRTGHMLFF